MRQRASTQTLLKSEKARLRQDAYERRARSAKRWGRRCMYLCLLGGFVAVWQDPGYGPKIKGALADAAHSADVYLGGDGNARQIVLAALTDVPG
ncbi:hypothetical protein [Roseovarius sp. MMSF_3281]|uniref:hypothetical protein n=1 Tax=Roseovarius sp. MMSF_3281 TaxID=3046694 RepID=UPI00273CFD3C|nr:hypothetical protein [Roseovarius sp. MMSF_3281]